MLTRTVCPVCKGTDFKEVLRAKDHTVSGEVFGIQHCQTCSHRFTSPVPDQHEIGPYYKSADYVSHTNTSQGLINRIYQIVRKITLKSKRRLIIAESGKLTGRLLDVGSGAGAFLSTMKGAGWQVKGLEPDPDARAVAQNDFGVESQPIEELMQLPEGQWDVITMWHVLEHVHALDAYLDKYAKLLAPGGRLVIAVPNYDSYDADKYGAAWAAYDVPRHLYHFCPTSMQQLLELHQFKLLKMKRMPFDSFYVSMLSERHKNGSMLKAVWNGFCSYWVALGNVARCSSVIYVIQK
jgi:2-polyprenyl-3-methyl-5-hydroxy-6-metoxy-1,4-benzoquinol methylase